jgi:hypothetical protein
MCPGRSRHPDILLVSIAIFARCRNVRAMHEDSTWSRAMSDPVKPERIATVAAAARVPLPPEAAARIATVLGSTIERFAATGRDMPFETEPATFAVVQWQEIER